MFSIGAVIQKSMLADFIVGLALGDQHSIILKPGESVWSTGYNEYGQLGDGSTADSFKFVWAFLSDAKAVAVGNDHSMVLKQDGSVWATGQNLYGRF